MGLPEQLQQFYYFQKGMISLIKDDENLAREQIERAVSEDTDEGWDGEQAYIITLSSLL